MNNINEIRNKNNASLPAYYSWQLHLFANTSLIVLLVSISIYSITSFNLNNTLWLFLFFWAWVFIEYFIHRFVLHGENKIKTKARESHSVFHHGYFTNLRMKLEQLIDVNRILLFTKDLLSVMSLSGAISFGLSFIDKDLAFLSLLASALYMGLYEITHSLCHLNYFQNLKFLQRIKKHHETHHNLQHMQHFNFAVVFPFIDSIFGTRKK